MATDDRRLSPDDRHALELIDSTRYGRISVHMGALPFVTVVRHLVSRGHLLLRMHAGYGYHEACDGNVVAYGADSAPLDRDELWSVQFVGTAHGCVPDAAELERFGAMPRYADGHPFAPTYLRVAPQFITVHHITRSGTRSTAHSM